MVIIPTLAQISAEELASVVVKNERTRRFLQRYRLSAITNSVHINFLKYVYYERCTLKKFIAKEWTNACVIIKSVPRSLDNTEFKVTVGDKRMLYVSTLSDLGVDMLKLDFPMGEYGLAPFGNGYILKTSDYNAHIRDAVQLFNQRDFHAGLAGSNWGGYSTNTETVGIFNRFISESLQRDYVFWLYYHNEPHRRLLIFIRDKSLIPVLFYLTEDIGLDDLSKIKLACRTNISNCGNVEACWYVMHSEKGNIGICVKQESLFRMVRNCYGIGLLSANGYRAIGNFDVDNIYARERITDVTIFRRNHVFRCEMEPCYCKIYTDVIQER